MTPHATHPRKEETSVKKLFAILAAFLLLLTACAAAEEALFYYPLTPPETSGDWAYRLLDDGTAEITHYNGDAKTLDIPSELEGHVVTSIGKGAFYFGSLTSVIIPDSVKTIEDSAFSSCYYLASVTIPDINDLAFYKCQSLTSVTIPGSVTYIGENPFTYCENLTNVSVSYDNEYLGVENGALFTKPDRRLVCLPGAFPDRIYSMPEGIQIIGDSAFVGCRSLDSSIIPTALLRLICLTE